MSVVWKGFCFVLSLNLQTVLLFTGYHEHTVSSILYMVSDVWIPLYEECSNMCAVCSVCFFLFFGGQWTKQNKWTWVSVTCGVTMSSTGFVHSMCVPALWSAASSVSSYRSATVTHLKCVMCGRRSETVQSIGQLHFGSKQRNHERLISSHQWNKHLTEMWIRSF